MLVYVCYISVPVLVLTGFLKHAVAYIMPSGYSRRPDVGVCSKIEKPCWGQFRLIHWLQRLNSYELYYGIFKL